MSSQNSTKKVFKKLQTLQKEPENAFEKKWSK